MKKKFTIQSLEREDKISQNGKPYKLLWLTVAESRYKLRLFDRPKITANWKPFDIIELDESENTTQDGKVYKNYKLPDMMEEFRNALTLIKQILKQLENRIQILENNKNKNETNETDDIPDFLKTN